MKRHSSSSDEGFILVEGLVSLILLLVMLTLISSTLSFATRLAGLGRSRERIIEFAGATETLASWLASAQPAREPIAAGEGPILFDGRPDQISFLTLSTGDTQRGGVLAVTVGFNGQLGSKHPANLVFDAQPLALGVTILPEQTARQSLSGHITAARFSYFGAPHEGQPSRWQPDWQHTTRLPRLISLVADLDTGRGAQRIELAFKVASE